jgi:hypothetical protein
MLRPMFDLPIQNYIFDILHCKLRIVPQIDFQVDVDS